MLAYVPRAPRPSAGRCASQPGRRGAQERIRRSKGVVRAHLRALAQMQADLPKQRYDEDGIDAAQIFCSACGEDGDEDQKGDIVLCDAQGCDRAFHLRCLDPPLSAEDVPEGDADWMCHRCGARREQGSPARAPVRLKLRCPPLQRARATASSA